MESATTLLWNAVATGSRVKRIPTSFSLASAWSTPAVGPLMTTWVGWLWFARTTPSMAHSASLARRVSASVETALIAPGLAAASAIRSPRSRATRIASAALSAPAASRAMISPKLWPAVAAGFTPSEAISAA